MHSKSVDSLSLTRAGFIEYFLVATKLVHALTAIAPALFLLYYPGLVPVELRSNMLGLLLFFGALTVIMFQALDVYSDDIFSNRLRFRIMFFAWASAFCLLLFMYQGLGLFPYLSSKLVIFWFTGSLLLFGVQRLLVLRLYRAWMKRGMYLQRTVILGFTESGMHLAEYLVRNHDIRSGIIGFIDDRSERVPENYNSLPLLGNTKDLEKLIRQEQVDQVLVALPWFAEGRIGAIVHRLRQLPVNVLLVPDMAAFRHAHNRIVDVSGIPMFPARQRARPRLRPARPGRQPQAGLPGPATLPQGHRAEAAPGRPAGHRGPARRFLQHRLDPRGRPQRLAVLVGPRRQRAPAEAQGGHPARSAQRQGHALERQRRPGSPGEVQPADAGLGVKPPMRILWILPYSPWPTTSGGKTRQYHLLRSLAARGHRITVLLHSKQPVSAEDRQALEPFLERLVVLPRRPLRSLSTLLAALFAPYPLLASVNGLSAELQRTATELLREPWDVVQVEHSYSFQPYERPLRDAGQPFVLTEHNVESSLGAATYDRLPGWALPFVRYDQWRYRRWERRVMSQAAAVVAVTEKDARQLGAMLGRPVPVVVNGVDCEHFAAARPTPEAQRVLFLGNYEYAPNVDAVEWMLDEILPRVWAHCPEARMSVCGYALPAEWAQRWSDPRIEWQGFVPDLLQLQSSSSVFLAALRHGGGSKLKVLEALAAGLPLASTAQGVSGLELRDGEDYLGGESAEQLANAVVRLLQDPAQARALGENGRAYVRRAHDWSVAASQLEQVYAGLAEGAPACA